MTRTPARGVPELSSPDDRITRLEARHDDLAGVVADVRVAVGAISGKLDTVLAHVVAAHREQAATERTRISSRARVVVGIVGAVCAAAGVVVTALVGGCQ